MRLSSLLEIASYKKQNKNIKPLNEAYHSTLIHKFNNQLKKDYIMNRCFYGEGTYKNKAQCEYINLFCNYNNSLFHRIERNIHDFKYKPNHSFTDIEKYILSLTEPENLYNNLIDFQQHDYPYSQYIDKIEDLVKGDLAKFNMELAVWLKEICPDSLKHFKLSEITDNDIEHIETLKNIRNKKYKDALIFYLDYADRIQAISYQHKIFFCVNYIKNDTVYYYQDAKSLYYNQKEIPEDIKKCCDNILTESPYRLSSVVYGWLLQYTTKSIRIPVIKIGEKEIKDTCGTNSTVIIADDERKNTTPYFSGIFHAYAIMPNAIEDNTNTEEAELRELNNNYYAVELPAQIGKKKREFKKAIQVAKTSKEFTNAVNLIQNDVDTLFEIVETIQSIIYNNFDNPLLKKEMSDYSYRHITALEDITKYFLTYIPQLINLRLELLTAIGEFEKFNSSIYAYKNKEAALQQYAKCARINQKFNNIVTSDIIYHFEKIQDLLKVLNTILSISNLNITERLFQSMIYKSLETM